MIVLAESEPWNFISPSMSPLSSPAELSLCNVTIGPAAASASVCKICKLLAGEAVPIPTLPVAPSIVTLSVPFVQKITSPVE